MRLTLHRLQYERRDRSERHRAASRRQPVPKRAEAHVRRIRQAGRARNRPCEAARPHEVLHREEIARMMPEKPSKEGEVEALLREKHGGIGGCFASELRSPRVQSAPTARAQRKMTRRLHKFKHTSVQVERLTLLTRRL